jgi:hypothetical protein
VEPTTIPIKLQASSRTSRPSNAFMIFRSDFVKQHKHVGRRQQELSIMAACAWRALGTDGQTGWYEKAALAKGQYDIKSRSSRPLVNDRSRIARESMLAMSFTRTLCALSGRRIPQPAPARRRMRKSLDQPIITLDSFHTGPYAHRAKFDPDVFLFLGTCPPSSFILRGPPPPRHKRRTTIQSVLPPFSYLTHSDECI